MLLKTPAGRLVHADASGLGLASFDKQRIIASRAIGCLEELVHSPLHVLGELDGIFRLAMERDVPLYTAQSSSVLYAVRLWSRATAYAAQLALLSGRAEAAPRGFEVPQSAQLLEEKVKTWENGLLQEAGPKKHVK